MKFICPDCNHNKIECIQKNCILSSEVNIFLDGVTYNNPDILDGFIDRFQCQNCGYVILKDPDNDEEDLFEWLKKQEYNN